MCWTAWRRRACPAEADDVLSSAQAAAALLVGSGLMPGARVLSCAGPGVVEALSGAGYEVIDAGDDGSLDAEAVVVGFHRTFDFDRLDRAATAIRRGARFVATNLDPTYPGTERVLPGAGALVRGRCDGIRPFTRSGGKAGGGHDRPRPGAPR